MMNQKTATVFLVIAIFALGLFFASNGVAQEGPPADQIETIKSHWAQRDSQPECQKTISLLNKALSRYPNWEEGWNWLGYAYFMEGENKPADDKSRRDSYQHGMEAGQQVIKLNPNNAGGHHWYITNKACYGRERGIMRSVFYLPDILKEIKTVKSLDRKYDSGGPQRLITGIILQVPAGLRKAKGYSLEDAEKEMNEALSIAPDHPRNRLFMADLYFAMDKKEEAKKQLSILLLMKESDIPQWAPELRIDRGLAEQRMKKYFNQ